MTQTAHLVHDPTEANGAPASDPVMPSIRPPVFTAGDKEAFRTEDRHAAAAVILIMSGIFTLAVVGYTAICFWLIGNG